MKIPVERGHITAADAKKKTIKLPVYNATTEEVEGKWFLRSCYQIAREKQWEQYWEKANEEAFGGDVDSAAEFVLPTSLFAADNDD